MTEAKVKVSCSRCGQEVWQTPEQLRQLNDADKQVECTRVECNPPPPPEVIPEDERHPTGVGTIWGTILLYVTGAGKPVVTRTELVLGSWNRDKIRLGLAEYNQEYPDSNRVMVEVVKMVRDGKLYRPAPNRFALTEKGRRLVANLERGAADEDL